MPWVGTGLILIAVPLGAMFVHFTQSLMIGLVMAAIMLVAGFLFSAVAGYMAGLVGSSNNPISGVTIATILTAALLLLVLMGADNPLGPAAAIFIGATVACAAAIAGDNMQDLKAGRIVGATPVKQQIMQVVGVAASAFIMAPVLKLLLQAYGIGVPTALHPQPLAAPQATLMAAVAGGVFRGGLPWAMVMAGMAVAVLVILLDVRLEKRGSEFRTPVLAVAVGIYLPFELSVAIMLGGVVAWLVGRRRTLIQAAMPEATRGGFSEWTTTGDRHGLLFAAGLITGEALVGIFLAIPIVVTGDRNALAIFGVHEWVWPGVVLLLLVMFGLYRVALGDRTAIGNRS
jgi:putative OPT family oligopeptide transporter